MILIFIGGCHHLRTLVLKGTKMIALFYITLSVLVSLHTYQITLANHKDFIIHKFLIQNQINTLDGLLTF
jgi:hypothetical protein